MALKHAILAALLDGEASGYDLAKGFDASVANFWTTTPQQLYRELDSMCAAELIEADLVVQSGRPNKRLYSITDAGLAVLQDFATKTPKPSAIRDDLLVLVQASDAVDSEAIMGTLAARGEAAHVKLRLYLKRRDYLLNGLPEREYLAQAERVGPYLTLMRGIAFEQENIAWCERAIDALKARAAREPAGQ